MTETQTENQPETQPETQTEPRPDSRTAQVLGGFASPLRNPRVRLLFLGQVASRSSSLMFLVALASYALTQPQRGTLLAEVLLAQSTAALIILLLSGAVTDRVGARAILLTADATRCLALALLAVNVMLHGGHLWVPITAGAVMGVGDGVFEPGFAVALTRIIPADNRIAGNALKSVTWRLAAMAGSAVGGVVVAVSNAGAGFAVAAVGYALSWIALIRMGGGGHTTDFTEFPDPADSTDPTDFTDSIDSTDPPDPAGSQEKPSIWADLREGYSFLRSAPRLMALIVMSGLVTSLVMAPARVLMPLVLSNRFGTTAFYPTILTIEAVSGLAAGLFVGRRGALPRRGTVAVAGLLIYCCGYLTASQSGYVAVSVVAVAIGAMCLTTSAVAYASILQTSVPDRYLGRVMGFDSLLTIGGAPLVLSAIPLASTFMAPSRLLAALCLVAAAATVCCLLNHRIRAL
jgi:MFS family permease